MPFGDVVGKRIPSNEKLWDMLVIQAKHRFRVYPSMAASKWIHDQYIKEGGMFVSSKKEINPKMRREGTGDEVRPRELSKEEKSRVVKALSKHRRTV